MIVSESIEEDKIGLTPDRLRQMYLSYMPSRVLSTSLQLGVFSHIEAGNETVKEVAYAARASERGMRMLLDALVALQLITKMDGNYKLAPLAEKFLVPGKPEYLGDLFGNDWLWEGWSHLTQTIRLGKPYPRDEKQAAQYYPTVVHTFHVINREPARRAAHALGAGTFKKNMQVVDVACGSGSWGIAIAEADQQAHITAQDVPRVLDVTRQYLKRHGVEKRYEFLPGDLNLVEFGESRFDLALVGNIVHLEGENSSRNLFRRLYSALKPKGRIAIIDMIPNNERTGPPFAILFALTMLLDTEKGETYTLAEYTQWLTEAGFERVDTADIGFHSPLIIGFKN